VLAGQTGKKPGIRFNSAEKTVSGFAGCNVFNGGYSNADGVLIIGEMAMTMMACMDTMELESNYIAALRASSDFKMQEGQLRTYTAEGEELLIFEAQN
jgi:putative lipoprotein